MARWKGGSIYLKTTQKLIHGETDRIDGDGGGNFSALTLDVSPGTTISGLSTDGTFSGNSDTTIPTEKAIKTYVDAEAANKPDFTAGTDQQIARYNGTDAIEGSTVYINDSGNMSIGDTPSSTKSKFASVLPSTLKSTSAPDSLIVTAPSRFVEPLTSSLAPGESVPIPTLPELSILIASASELPCNLV